MTEHLLLVFVHGFRGSESTFQDFPERLKAIATHAHVQVKIYPSYKTAGDFQVAVKNLLDWLESQAQEQRKNGANQVQIVLLGHSMGGLVSAEAIIYWKQHPEVLDAEILGLIAYDTPFYSVNHRFVTTQALSHADQISQHVSRFWPAATTAAATRSTVATASKAVASIEYPAATKKSSGSSWGLLAGVVGVAAAGAAAYIAREKIQSSMTDVFDHLEFVSTLMDLEGCWNRVRRITQIPDIMFKCFYVQLSSVDGLPSDPRTFIALPPPETAHHFVPMLSRAEGEIEAHTTIFDASKNQHYYNLGLESIALISEMIARQERKRRG